MSLDQEPLRFSNEVENAVLQSSLPDFALAHGAGIIADPQRYRFFQVISPTPRLIYGVTAISLHRNGEPTFRTATFGIDNQTVVEQLDNLAADEIEDTGKHTSHFPKAAAALLSKLSGVAIYEEINEGGRCTLGGVVSHSTDVPNQIGTKTFVANTLVKYMEDLFTTPGVIIGTAIRERTIRKKRVEAENLDIPSSQVLEMYRRTIANASRRGEPVTVDRLFTARV